LKISKLKKNVKDLGSRDWIKESRALPGKRALISLRSTTIGLNHVPPRRKEQQQDKELLA